MRVLKFGGSSVGSPDRIKQVIDIISATLERCGRTAVVFSAFQGVTDSLIDTAHKAARGDMDYKKAFAEIKRRHIEAVNSLIGETDRQQMRSDVNSLLDDLRQVLQGVYLLKELTPKSLDYIMSFGERLSAFTIAGACRSRGIDACFVDSRRLIRTDANFGSARVDAEITARQINEFFKDESILYIITGFIGSTAQNETTTLGRGGSDFSASIFGAALDADEIEIWTDVDGVMTADPRKVKKAFPVKSMSYEEAMEMSHFGAKVIHPPTMRPAMMKNIPLRIKNTFNPSFEGTLVCSLPDDTHQTVTGITSINDISLIRVEGSGMIGAAGIARRIFSAMAEARINIILISQASSEHSICFAVLPGCAKQAREKIASELRYEISEGIINEIVVENELSIIAVVGENMRKTAGIAGRIFQSLGNNGINLVAIAQGSSELNISMVISRHDEAKALNVIHDSFFLSDRKSLNLFVVGTGLIGRTLFQQISNQIEFLYKELMIDLKIAALANSRKMLFDTNGITMEDWEERLFSEGKDCNIDQFISEMKKLNLANSIFVDCTSSELVMSKYLEILSSSISIVTPNKKANSSSHDSYKELHEAARKFNATFLYETNVGAGLPIISTLHDLVLSGDKILKIQGVLSGTLSYIFNTFDGTSSFTATVRDARDKGFTEPDPRDDLNGMDVARKLLILAREAGFTLELQDISVDNLIPEELRDPKIPVEEFLERLQNYDKYYEGLLSSAKAENKRLRYIAEYCDGKAEIKLTAVDSRHPFYSLSLNDNIVAFTTVYYRQRPIVIQGPGAGAEVTSGGVFADIIRIANYLY